MSSKTGVIAGRIFKVPIAPPDRPWMWASGHNDDIHRAAHGYGPTREAAMAAFAKKLAEGVAAAVPMGAKTPTQQLVMQHETG